MLKILLIVIVSAIVLTVIIKKLWNKENLTDFVKDENNNKIPDGVDEIISDTKENVKKVKTKVKETTTEVKRRAKRVKEELKDVSNSAKNLVDQSVDVIDAVKGGNRKGRKPKK